LTLQRGGSFKDALAAHQLVLQTFCTATGLHYWESKAVAERDADDCDYLLFGCLLFNGRKRSRRDRHDHLQVMITTQGAGVTLVACLVEIHLPPCLQQQGLGTALVNSLIQVWLRLGVREVRAIAGSDAGAASLTSWGFTELSASTFGPNTFSLTLVPSD